MKALYFANTDWYLYNFRLPLLETARKAGYEVVCVCPSGPYVSVLRMSGFRVCVAPMQRASLNPVRELRLLFWLSRLVQREQPVLLHGFTIKCAVYLGLVGRFRAATGRRVARIHAVAGMGYVFISPSLKARLLRPVVRVLLRLAFGGKDSRVIVQNPDDAASLSGAGLVSAVQLRLIRGSGVDCNRFQPSVAAVGLEAAARPVCFVLASRLLWDKGIGEYVAAIRLLQAQGVTARFFLAGAPDDGNPASIPLATVQGWQAEGVLTALGHVSDMPQLYAEADVVLLPSYREGLPRSLIEAGAVGCALIATDAPGCREVVVHEVTGLLVPVRDAAALANALERLAINAELRRQFGRAARAHVLNQFSQESVIQKTMDVYEEILTRPP